MLLVRNSISLVQSAELSSWPTLKYFAGSEKKATVSNFSQGSHVSWYFFVQVSLTPSNCYKPLEDFATIFPFSFAPERFCLMAAMMHCLEVTWSPLISIILKSVGKRSFWWREEGTAFSWCNHLRPIIAVYGEGTFTTRNLVSKLIGLVWTTIVIRPIGRMLSPENSTKGAS